MTTVPERKVLLNVVRAYAGMPHLWQKNHPSYKNKQMRKEGAEALLEIYKQFDEDATTRTVKKKLDNMRTAFTRELEKVITSEEEGSEVYVPTLWYFDEFSFLRSQTELNYCVKKEVSALKPNVRRQPSRIMKAKVFTDYQDRVLVSLVKQIPMLYDSDDPKYSDKDAREVAWQKIEDKLEIRAFDCKMRWRRMRDAFRHHLLLQSQNKTTDFYKYHNEMSFIVPFLKDIEMSNYYNDNTEDQIDYNDDEKVNTTDEYQYTGSLREVTSDEEHNENEAATIVFYDSEDSEYSGIKRKRKKILVRDGEKVIKREKHADPLISFADSVGGVGTSIVQMDPRDHIDSFLLSIGTVLRNLSPHQLNLAKSKLFAVVQEHELQDILDKKIKERSDSE